MTRIVGIDPGLTGAVALIAEGHLRSVYDMPTLAGEIEPLALADILGQLKPDLVVLEDVHCNGRNGSKANWSLGFSKGVIQGVVSGLSHPLVKISPQEWKKMNGLSGKDKEASRRLAMELWPDYAQLFKRVKDDGRAEAALIARGELFKMVRLAHAG